MKCVTHGHKKMTERKRRFLRGSNPRPSACKADVITTTPRNQYTIACLYFAFCSKHVLRSNIIRDILCAMYNVNIMLARS